MEQGKGQKDRYVMLSPRLLDTLRSYWRAARPMEWLFPGDRPGQPITRSAVELRLQVGAPHRRHHQAGHAAFSSPRLRRPPARVRHRCPYHPTTARAPQPSHDSPLSTDRHQQGLLDIQSAGLAAAAGCGHAEAVPAGTLLSAAPMGPARRKWRTCSAATARPTVSSAALRSQQRSAAP